MKRLYCKSIQTLLVLTFISGGVTNASFNHIIPNFLDNGAIEFTMSQATVRKSAKGIFEELIVQYPQLVTLDNDAVQTNINLKIKSMMFDQVSKDSFRIALIKDMSHRLDVYFSSLPEALDEYKKNGAYRLAIKPNFWRSTTNPDISVFVSHIDYAFTPVCGDVITFITKVHYVPMLAKELLNVNFVYYEVIYFNTIDGTIYTTQDVFNKDKFAALNSLAQTKFENSVDGLDINRVESTISDYARARTEKMSKGMLHEFSVDSSGFAAMKMYSIAFVIPPLSNSTKLINGCGVAIRFSFAEIAPYLNPNGPYKALIDLVQHSATARVRNDIPFDMNRHPYLQVHQILRDLFPFTRKDGLREVNMVSDARRQEKGVFIPYYDFGYNTQGLMSKMIIHGSTAKRKIETLFEYNPDATMSKLVILENGIKIYEETFSYDGYGNPLLIHCRDRDNGISDYFSSYVGSIEYREEYSFPFDNGDELDVCDRINYSNAGLMTEVYEELFLSVNPPKVKSFEYNQWGLVTNVFSGMPAVYNTPEGEYQFTEAAYQQNNKRQSRRITEERKYDLQGRLIQSVYNPNRGPSTEFVLRYGKTELPEKIVVKQENVLNLDLVFFYEYR